MVITRELILTIAKLDWMQGRKLSFQQKPASYMAKAKMMLRPYRQGEDHGNRVLGNQGDCVIAFEEEDKTTVYSDSFAITDGTGLFQYAGFALIDLRGVDTSGCLSMRSMFEDCRDVELNLSGLNTSNVTDMSRMFLQYRTRQSLDLSSFDTAKVKNMNYMFFDCDVDELDLSGFHLDSLQDASYMFSELGCRRLNLKYWNIKNVKNTKFMFEGAGIDYFWSTNEALSRKYARR